jgi:hypothetical protein
MIAVIATLAGFPAAMSWAYLARLGHDFELDGSGMPHAPRLPVKQAGALICCIAQ